MYVRDCVIRAMLLVTLSLFSVMHPTLSLLVYARQTDTTWGDNAIITCAAEMSIWVMLVYFTYVSLFCVSLLVALKVKENSRRFCVTK